MTGDGFVVFQEPACGNPLEEVRCAAWFSIARNRRSGARGPAMTWAALHAVLARTG
jgi:hypothetical protein